MTPAKKISEEEVRHIAELARIELTPEESEKFSKEISDILGYVQQLEEVDTEDIQPISQISGKVNILREDAAVETPQTTRDLMASNYPLNQDGYIKVKQIL